ncbi:MAG: 2,3-diphosphoglycerate synthetase [Thermoleophilia bacterium]|nr:2,3-diphosphoglycerate synthetase [Thermoleophilia bacterium]
MKKAIALIDGEHYPNVVREALEEVSRQFDVKAAVFAGGTEKIDLAVIGDPERNEYGIPVYFHDENAEEAFAQAIRDHAPEVIVDLSDEPVLGYWERFRYASQALAAGIRYQGSDFTLSPPTFHKLSRKPSLSIIGTGKRIGKTAVSGYVSRIVGEALSGKGYREGVVVIAMGRGGPLEPEVIEGRDKSIGVAELLSYSRQGKHAASDYFEDAVLSSVTTVGCRRCGGGLAGMPYVSNVEEGAAVAEELPADLLIFEGSGAALPPIDVNRAICVVGADQPLDYILGYMGTYRLLISDAVLMTMCEEPLASPEKIRELIAGIEEIKPGIEVVPTVLRPKPDGNIMGKRVAYFTTAQGKVVERIAAYIGTEFGCSVNFVSSQLSDRVKLRADLERLNVEETDVILTEIKAAAIDVVTEEADRRGIDVVFCDNVPVEVGGSGRLEPLLERLAEEAIADFSGKELG